MTKKLFTQIKNEWQSNTWLALELLVVSVVMWYVVDYIYTQVATTLEPKGFDIEHCYLIEMGLLTDKSPNYIPGQSNEEQRKDVLEMLDRLKHRPDVEAVSLSQNSYPYNGSNSTGMVQHDTLVSPDWTIRSFVTPDFVRVFRYRGTRGETPEQLAAMLEDDNRFLASDNLYRNYNVPLTSLVGKPFYLFGDTTRAVTLGAALQNVRYCDFAEGSTSYRMVHRMSTWWMNNATALEWCVRVRPDQDHGFIERLKADSEKLYRVGNIFIAEVRSFADIRNNYQRSWDSRLRNYMAGIGFLLLNIFLGLLGTFWFRTQQRRKEVALRMAMGSSRRAIFSRLMGEGILLLTLAALPGIVVAFNIGIAELVDTEKLAFTAGRFATALAATWALMVLMIVAGIWYPARKAMQVQPAEALHDE